MLKFVLKNRQQVEDLVRGLTFYGTGGGGSYQRGVDLLMEKVDAGVEVGWVGADDIADDEYSVSPFLMGSLKNPGPEVEKEMREIYYLGDQMYDETKMMVHAVNELGAKVGKKISALVPIELGGANAAACICAAAELGIVTLDGDYTGRAIPEIQQTTPFILEQTLLPLVACDGWGNIATVEKAFNWRMTERIGKQLSVAGFNRSAQAAFLMDGKETKRALVKGTMTECYEVGKALREAVEAGKDPADAIAAKMQGWVACKGKVTKKVVDTRSDYYWVTHEITGQGAYAGTTIKVWVKNENHISWKNGEVFVTSPDMIQIIDSKTGHPYTNDKIEEGMEVSIIMMKARDIFRTERGLLTLGPKAFGFDVEYKPVEEIMK